MLVEKIIVVLAIMGALDSFYTALQQWYPGLFQFCFSKKGQRVDCYEILHSRFARIFIVPNTWIGVLAYSVLAALYVSIIQGQNLFGMAYEVGAAIAICGTFLGLYLVYVQVRILRKFCIFCLSSTLILTVITALAVSLLI